MQWWNRSLRDRREQCSAFGHSDVAEEPSDEHTTLKGIVSLLKATVVGGRVRPHLLDILNSQPRGRGCTASLIHLSLRVLVTRLGDLRQSVFDHKFDFATTRHSVNCLGYSRSPSHVTLHKVPGHFSAVSGKRVDDLRSLEDHDWSSSKRCNKHTIIFTTGFDTVVVRARLTKCHGRLCNSGPVLERPPTSTIPDHEIESFPDPVVDQIRRRLPQTITSC